MIHGGCGGFLHFARTRVQAETLGPPVWKGTEIAHSSLVPLHSCPAKFFPLKQMRLRDQHARWITDLRISITDRCNYRCVYCRTGNEGALSADFPFSDYLRMVRIFVQLGIEKVRVTGGEPLLRAGIVEFIRDLSGMRSLDEKPIDLALTTNGHLLAELAAPLKEAGLRRVTVSMDAVDAT